MGNVKSKRAAVQCMHNNTQDFDEAYYLQRSVPANPSATLLIEISTNISMGKLMHRKVK